MRRDMGKFNNEVLLALPDSQKYFDMDFISREGQKIGVHQLIMGSISPLLKLTIEKIEDPVVLFPEVSQKTLQALISLVYFGSIKLDTKCEMENVGKLAKTLGIMFDPEIGVDQLTNTIMDQYKDVKRPNPKEAAQSSNKTTEGVHTLAVERERPPKMRKESKEDITEERASANLANLVSVAEAFEISQRPDFNNIVASENRISSDTDDILVKTCILCQKKVLGKHSYGRHMKNVHSKIFGPYNCPKCGKEAPDGIKLMTHMYCHTGPRGLAISRGQRFQCKFCSSNYSTVHRLNHHLKVKHNVSDPKKVKFKCNYISGKSDPPCDNGFNTANAFAKHMLEAHELNPWLCNHCNQRFRDKQNLELHKMSQHEDRKFLCDICHKQYKNSRQLYIHRRLHQGQLYLCPHCGLGARSPQNLRGHIKARHEEDVGITNEEYNCEFCDMNFKKKHHLVSHVRSKTHLENFSKAEQAPEKLESSSVRINQKSESCVEYLNTDRQVFSNDSR